MTTPAIKSQITKHIKSSMGNDNPRMNLWYVGITNNEKRRKAEHNYKTLGFKYWKSFATNSMDDANSIEQYFHTKGTSNKPSKYGAIGTSKIVYVFKKPASKPQGMNGPFTEKNLFKQLFEI